MLKKMLQTWNRNERDKLNGNWDIIETLINGLRKQINSLVANAGKDNAENVAARTNTNQNITYVSVGDRLDSEYQTVTKEIAKKVDLTYFDMIIANLVDGGPRELFYSVATLQSTYPTGEIGTYLVFDSSFVDGAHTFMWKDGAWQDLGVYQANAIRDNSVTSAKRTPLGESLRILKGVNAIPNYSVSNKTLTVTRDTLIMYNTKSYVVPDDVVISCVDISVSSENVKIVFDTVNKSFRALWYNSPPSEFEIIVCSVKTSTYPYIFDASFIYTVDGLHPTYPVTSDKVLDISPMWKTVQVLTSGNYPRVDNQTKKLIFPGGDYGFIFLVGGKPYTDFMTLSALQVDLTMATGTSAWCVLLNLSTSQIELRAWGVVENLKNTHALLATFRIANGKYHFSMPCPFYVDGKLYGADYATTTEVSQIVADASGREFNPIGANIKAIAHRGYDDAPENTLVAVRRAKEKGFNYVEIDVLWTSDNVPVLLHDNTIDRTSNGTGDITTLSYDYVRNLDFGSWKDVKYAGEKIPNFEEFIILCKRLNIHPYIEIKSDVSEAQATILYNIVKKHGMLKNVTWTTFYINALRFIKTLHPAAALSLAIMDADASSKLNELATLKNEYNNVIASMYYVTLEDTTIELIRELELGFEAWTVNYELVVNQLADKGVDGIITDFLNVGEILSR